MLNQIGKFSRKMVNLAICNSSHFRKMMVRNILLHKIGTKFAQHSTFDLDVLFTAANTEKYATRSVICHVFTTIKRIFHIFYQTDWGCHYFFFLSTTTLTNGGWLNSHLLLSISVLFLELIRTASLACLERASLNFPVTSTSNSTFSSSL